MGMIARMDNDRPNTELAAAVDHALTMEDVRGAVAYLADHGPGFALICRVLAEPTRRRSRFVDLPPATN